MEIKPPPPPEFDVEFWKQQPYGERLRMMCVNWAMQGFGVPLITYVFYALKIALYVGGFLFFVTVGQPDLHVSNIGDWWATPIAFQKAILWTFLYEGLGLGCASGPLTGRYNPPITAVAHWVRPGTLRLPPWPGRIPFTAGDTRTVFDVVLYLAVVITTVRALFSSQMQVDTILPIVIAAGLLGLRDKVSFLCHRSEHYLVTAAVFMFPVTEMWAGAKWIQAMLWIFAGMSKLNRHFPTVIAIMLSNHAFLRSRWFKRQLYVSYPTDLRPSKLALVIAHSSTFVELVMPIVLVFSDGGWPTYVALALVTALHANIFFSIPMGVPLEWNVMFAYGAWVLFGEHAEVRVWDIESPALWAILIVCTMAVPLWGNFRPGDASFLWTMRYYAGNWANSMWITKPGTLDRVDDALVTAAPSQRRQFEAMYDPELVERDIYPIVVGKMHVFRSMHLHGRAINTLIPRALADIPNAHLADYEVMDGEVFVGMALGWNFGDGHFGHEQLLEALQRRCHFEPGEIRAIFLESQPLHTEWMDWRILDPAIGVVESGKIHVSEFANRQPWEIDAAVAGPR